MRKLPFSLMSVSYIMACGLKGAPQTAIKIVGGSKIPDAWNDTTARATVALATEKQIELGQSFCSGAVVAANAIITSAKCVYGTNSEFKISIGRSTLTNSWFSVRAIKIYDQWRPQDQTLVHRDIALVFTRNNFPDSVQKVKIAQDLHANDWVRIAGFGISKQFFDDKGNIYYDFQSNGVLNYMDLKIHQVNKERCQFYEDANYKGIAPGDWGAPHYVMRNESLEIAGVTPVVELSKNINLGKIPVTLLTCYQDWIRTQLDQFPSL